MIGAIIGDVVGSRFEFNNILSKEFEFFHPNCEFTDDSVMTCAVAQGLMDSKERFRPCRESAASSRTAVTVPGLLTGCSVITPSPITAAGKVRPCVSAR